MESDSGRVCSVLEGEVSSEFLFKIEGEHMERLPGESKLDLCFRITHLIQEGEDWIKNVTNRVCVNTEITCTCQNFI